MSAALVLRCVIGKEFSFLRLTDEQTFTIGRAPECELQLKEPGISRRHARLSVDDNGAWVQDLDSANGTYLSRSENPNDQPGTIQYDRQRLARGERHPLHVGDLLFIGPATCVLELEIPKPRPVIHRADLIVLDPTMQNIYSMVDRIAHAPVSVLISGEPGTGKKLLAEAIVASSRRAQAAFLRVNCAALPEAVLESELFGSELDALIEETPSKPGLIERANGGTLLLEEVSAIPQATQVSFLRVIESRLVQRLGSNEFWPVDVRFISAATRSLEQEVRRGAFRDDLYFRLNGVSLTIPPLRERQSEIEPLAESFIQQACRGAGRSEIPVLSPEARRALLCYSWRGNVRELKNVIEGAVMMCVGRELESEHFPPEIASANSVRVARPPPPSVRYTDAEATLHNWRPEAPTLPGFGIPGEPKSEK